MQLEDYLDFFDNPYAIRLKGHRIGLEHVVEQYYDGASPEKMIQDWPGVSLEQLYAAITYYLHNKAAIDEYMTEIEQYVEEQIRLQEANPSPVMLRMRALKEQWKREGRRQYPWQR